jgi:tetratricopeptide (TPR) repeat protein
VILTGNAWPTAQGLRLDVALVQNGSGDRLWIRNFEVELQDAPLVYGEVAREVARVLQLSPPVSRPARPKPKPAAYQDYLRAVSLRHQMQYEQAAKAFEESILLDPGFAPAWAELALCRVRYRDKVDVTEAAAQRALALDPELAESHVAVAQVLFRHNLDWEGAGREYRRALALNPGSANAYSAYSFYLMALGRGDEAIVAIQRARELNPASMELGSALAWYLYLDRRYEDAMREIPATLELYSLNAAVTTEGAKRARNSALDTLLNCSLKTGDPVTALKAVKGIEEIFDGPRRAAEIRAVAELWPLREQRIQELIRKGTSDTYAEAKNALMLGDRGRALDLLTSNCSPVAWASPYAAVEPLFDPLHSDPRWGQVLDCLKLPADAPARARSATRRQAAPLRRQ